MIDRSDIALKRADSSSREYHYFYRAATNYKNVRNNKKMSSQQGNLIQKNQAYFMSKVGEVLTNSQENRKKYKISFAFKIVLKRKIFY